MKSPYLIILFLFLFSSLASRAGCTQKSLHINPCFGGSSSGGNDWAGGNDFETLPVWGDRIEPVEIREGGGGPNLGHLGSIGSNYGDRGEPGAPPIVSAPEENETREEERPKKRNCVLFDGITHRGQIIGVSTKSCSNVTSSSQTVTFAVETYSEATQRVATKVTLETIQEMAPQYSGMGELTQDINATLTEVSEAAINDFINQTMAQISINLEHASIEIDSKFQSRLKDYLFDEINYEVQEYGGGPSLFISNQNNHSQDYIQDELRQFASPNGLFRERVKNLDLRLENLRPTEGPQIKAKELARSTLKIADEEHYLGNTEVAHTALDIATDLADFAAGFIPGLSVAKDAFELFVGMNPVTGESLNSTQRFFAGLGILTLGTSNWFKNSHKIINRILKTNSEIINNSTTKKIASLIKDFSESFRNTIFDSRSLSSIKDIVANEVGALSIDHSFFKSLSQLNYPNLWTLGKHRNSMQNALSHYNKHGKEFPNINNAVEYVEEAHKFIKDPPLGTFSKVRSNGDTIFYNPQIETFAVKAQDGAPKTMFKPDPSRHGYLTNMDYYNAQ